MNSLSLIVRTWELSDQFLLTQATCELNLPLQKLDITVSRKIFQVAVYIFGK